jgi:hypothetical protein
MATVRLTDGNDTYTTNSGDEFVFALGGNDKITVKGVFYDEAEDAARISVYGGPGDDRLISSMTAIEGQRLYGGSGNDHIEINGSPTASGYAAGAGGNDTIVCKFGDEGCILDGGTGNDRLVNEKGYDVTMYGRSGDDILDAGTLLGDDTFQAGGPGRDISIGGPGEDRFILSTGDTVAGPRRDVVKKFTQGSDLIDLSRGTRTATSAATRTSPLSVPDYAGTHPPVG